MADRFSDSRFSSRAELSKLVGSLELELSQGKGLWCSETHRKLGIAAKLMTAAHDAMRAAFDAKYCSLHVRVSNAAAIHLYVDVLGYERNDIEAKYYADGEDAHDMRKTFGRLAGELDKQEGSDKALVDRLKAMAV